MDIGPKLFTNMKAILIEQIKIDIKQYNGIRFSIDISITNKKITLKVMETENMLLEKFTENKGLLLWK